MYIQRGGVKLSVRVKSGRETVIAVLGPGDFLGEGCLAGERRRIRTATAITPSTIVVVPKHRMTRLLGRPGIAQRLLSHALVRHAVMEQDLIDQLFSSTEKRLARTLLLLARYDTREGPRTVIRHVSNATLADMVGATPARISTLMNMFQRAGFIEYNRKLVVHRSLLNVLLHD
nr:Crp/FNR family transcriptional regulator [uncultured bacterium]